ncbi:membrane protein insertase YidC [Tsuneonella sp. HG249]
MENQRNLLLAVVLCGLLLFGWDAGMKYLYPQPPEAVRAQATASAAAPGETAAATPTREGGLTDPAAIALERRDLASALQSPQRVRIAAPEVSGSIDLVGARIDDLTLKTHTETIEDSDPVRLFSPAGTPAQHFAQFGWVGEGVKVPDAKSVWTAEGGPLAPDRPVTLTWPNGQGQVFKIELSIDDKFMITAKQTVGNGAGGPIVLRPFATVSRTSATASSSSWQLHSGPIGSFDNAVDFDWDYDDIAESPARRVAPKGKADWVGFTDIYWMSALIPQSNADTEADIRSLGGDLYRADVIYSPVTVPSGRQISRTTQLFAGAKESTALNAYQAAGVPQFENAIDWGWFGVIEKPILWLLRQLYSLAGNFGVAIILLTLIVRLVMFPIAQKQFASMAAMRAIQPKMKAVQERFKDDKQKQQQEIMALYKSEGVNPLTGCLPILLQIPIFYGLYKVLMVGIEMRHKPFALWIQDLSAPDPAHILNLFGLLPFTPPSFLAIGPLAILLGISMWATFRLNPPAADPIQAQMFKIMPWILMFAMAPFAAGLLIYWITNNLLTLAQQTYLYSKHPQLRAQAEKDKTDRERAAARDAKAKG